MARVEALCAEPALGASPLAGSEVAVSLAQGAVACYDASTNTPTRTWQLPSGRSPSAPAVRSGRLVFAALSPTASRPASVVAWRLEAGPRAALEARPAEALGLGRRLAADAKRASSFPAVSDVIPTGADAVALVLEDGTVALVAAEEAAGEGGGGACSAPSLSVRSFAPPLTSTVSAFAPLASSPRLSRSGELVVVGLAQGPGQESSAFPAAVVWTVDLEAQTAAPEPLLELAAGAEFASADGEGLSPSAVAAAAAEGPSSPFAACCVSAASPASVAALSASGEALALWRVPSDEDRAALASARAALEPAALSRLPTKLVGAAGARAPPRAQPGGKAKGKRPLSGADAAPEASSLPRLADLGDGALAVLGRVPLEGQAPLFLVADWSLGTVSPGPLLPASAGVPRPARLWRGAVALASAGGVAVVAVAPPPAGVRGLLSLGVGSAGLAASEEPANDELVLSVARDAEATGASTPPVVELTVSSAPRPAAPAPAPVSASPSAVLDAALAAAGPPTGAALAAAARLDRWDDAAALLARGAPASLAGCPGAARAAAEAGRLDVLWKLLSAPAPDLEPEEVAALVALALSAEAPDDPAAARALSSAAAQPGPSSSSALLEASREARRSARESAAAALAAAEDASASPAARRAAARRALAARAAAGRGDRDPALHAVLGAAVEEAPLRAAARSLPSSLALRLVRRVARELRDAERDAEAAAALGLPDGAARGPAAARAAGLPPALPPAPDAARLLAWASALVDAHLVALSVSARAEPALRQAAAAVGRSLAHLRGAGELAALLGGLAAAAAPLCAAAKTSGPGAESKYAVYWLDLSVGGQ